MRKWSPASFIVCPGALILGGCVGSAAVLMVGKFARSLRRLDREFSAVARSNGGSLGVFSIRNCRF